MIIERRKKGSRRSRRDERASYSGGGWSGPAGAEATFCVRVTTEAEHVTLRLTETEAHAIVARLSYYLQEHGTLALCAKCEGAGTIKNERAMGPARITCPACSGMACDTKGGK